MPCDKIYSDILAKTTHCARILQKIIRVVCTVNRMHISYMHDLFETLLLKMQLKFFISKVTCHEKIYINLFQKKKNTQHAHYAYYRNVRAVW